MSLEYAATELLAPAKQARWKVEGPARAKGRGHAARAKGRGHAARNRSIKHTASVSLGHAHKLS